MFPNGYGAMVVNNCPLCMNKQRRIDELEDEINSLRVALGREQRKMEDGFFGSSTPSSKKPFKKSTEKKEQKPKGARPGHEGHGRKGHEEGTKKHLIKSSTKGVPDFLLNLRSEPWKNKAQSICM